jgi:hypothetical protein
MLKLIPLRNGACPSWFSAMAVVGADAATHFTAWHGD